MIERLCSSTFLLCIEKGKKLNIFIHVGLIEELIIVISIHCCCLDYPCEALRTTGVGLSVFELVIPTSIAFTYVRMLSDSWSIS